MSKGPVQGPNRRKYQRKIVWFKVYPNVLCTKDNDKNILTKLESEKKWWLEYLVGLLNKNLEAINWVEYNLIWWIQYDLYYIHCNIFSKINLNVYNIFLMLQSIRWRTYDLMKAGDIDLSYYRNCYLKEKCLLSVRKTDNFTRVTH